MEKKVLEAQPYTMLADERYQRFEHYMTEEIPDQQQMEDAVSNGEKGLFNELFIKTLGDRISFGEYLARIYCRQNDIRNEITEEELIVGIQKEFRANGMYKLKLETLSFPEGMSREEKEKWLFTSYEYTSVERSSKSIMGSIDFMSNTRVLDKKDLRERFAKPVNRVAREDLFLFAFGMKLSPDEVTEFIRKYLGEPGIRWKDYREVIYFWCLRNAAMGIKSSFSGIEGVYNAFRYYYRIPRSGMMSQKDQAATHYYQQRAVSEIRTDMDFRIYLGMLKEKQPETGYSRTRSDILEKNLKRLHFQIADEQNKSLNVIVFEKDLWGCVDPDNVYPLDKETIRKIGFPPIWKHELTGKKISTHIRDISREDILLSSFLYYAHQKEFQKQESEIEDYVDAEPYVEDLWWEEEYGRWNRDLFWDDDLEEMNDPLEIKEAFESAIELDLASCDMHAGLYLPNPFEMFLLLCLLTPTPYSVFMNAWSVAAEK